MQVIELPITNFDNASRLSYDAVNLAAGTEYLFKVSVHRNQGITMPAVLCIFAGF